MRQAMRIDHWRGALLGTALGDAVGAPFEGSPSVDRPAVRGWLDDLHDHLETSAFREALATALALGPDVEPAQVGAHVGADALPGRLLARLEARDELVTLADHLTHR